MKQAHGLKEVRHECVDLVVGACGVAGEFEHSDVSVSDIEGDGSDSLKNAEHYVAGFAFGLGHEAADKAWEVAVDDFDEVAVVKVDVLERVEWKAVVVGACYVAEVGHVQVGDDGVALPGASIDEE